MAQDIGDLRRDFRELSLRFNRLADKMEASEMKEEPSRRFDPLRLAFRLLGLRLEVTGDASAYRSAARALDEAVDDMNISAGVVARCEKHVSALRFARDVFSQRATFFVCDPMQEAARRMDDAASRLALPCEQSAQLGM